MTTEQTMSRDEFLAYAEEVLFGEGAECLYEAVAEHNGEVAMFGDAGPGSGYRLRQSIAEFNSIARQYARLTGRRTPPAPTLRSPA
jgi:hypothetical protein